MSKRLSHKHKVRLARRLMSQDERRTHCGLWDSIGWWSRSEAIKARSRPIPKTFAESVEK